MKMRVGGQIAKSKLLTLANKKEGGLDQEPLNIWTGGLLGFITTFKALRIL